MALKNSDKQYGTVSKFFHWTVGLLIIGLLPVGIYMMSLEPSPEKGLFYGWHKQLGIVVLGLMVLRTVWWMFNAVPKMEGQPKPWERFLARLVHVILFAAAFAMPLSGWMMSSAGGHPVILFGLYTLPPLVEQSKELGALAHAIHTWAGYALIGVIGLHVLAALKHHFINGDKTLVRMLPFGKG